MKTTMTRRTPAKTRIRNFFGHRPVLRASSSHNPAEYKQVATQPLRTMHGTPRCGDNVIADLVNGQVVRSYVTPQTDENVSTTDHSNAQNPVVSYYNADIRRSVVNLTATTGTVVNDYAYSAYGDAVDSLTGGSVEQRYTYTGRELSDTTENHCFRNRWYGAASGTFYGRDPLGYVNGMSTYAGWFAAKMGIDPTGWRLIERDPAYNVELEDAVGYTYKKITRCECSCVCDEAYIGSSPQKNWYPKCDFDFELQIQYAYGEAVGNEKEARKAAKEWLDVYYNDGEVDTDKLNYWISEIGKHVAADELVRAINNRDGSAIFAAIRRHEEAHAEFYRQWYASRVAAMNAHNRELRNHWQGGIGFGEPGKEVCEWWLTDPQGPTRVCDDLKDDLDYFTGFQGGYVHNNATEWHPGIAIPPFPMTSLPSTEEQTR